MAKPYIQQNKPVPQSMARTVLIYAFYRTCILTLNSNAAP
jgi:hypothetical protein